MCLLKNITPAANLKYMGYKIKFYALLFRFGPMGILENNTIRSGMTISYDSFIQKEEWFVK